MNYATMLHGEPDDVLDQLDGCADPAALSMALSNAFGRIKRLEAQLAAMQRPRQDFLSEALNSGDGVYRP